MISFTETQPGALATLAVQIDLTSDLAQELRQKVVNKIELIQAKINDLNARGVEQLVELRIEVSEFNALSGSDRDTAARKISRRCARIDRFFYRKKLLESQRDRIQARLDYLDTNSAVAINYTNF